MLKFSSLVQSIDWSELYRCMNPSDCYNLFETKLRWCYNESFKVVKLSRSRAKDKKWFTKGLRKCSKKKLRLYKNG